jgi:hypothetical protein
MQGCGDGRKLLGAGRRYSGGQARLISLQDRLGVS